MRCSTRSSAFLPGTGWPAIGEAAVARGVALWTAADCDDCARATAGRDRSAITATEARRFDGIISPPVSVTNFCGRSVAVIDGRRHRRVVGRGRAVIAVGRRVITRRAIIAAIRRDRGTEAETHEAADDRRARGVAVVVVVVVTPAMSPPAMPVFRMGRRAHCQARDEYRGA